MSVEALHLRETVSPKEKLVDRVLSSGVVSLVVDTLVHPKGTLASHGDHMPREEDTVVVPDVEVAHEV